MDHSIGEIRSVLQRFQDGYSARDVAQLEEYMMLFAPDEDIELIGIGAASFLGSNKYP